MKENRRLRTWSVGRVLLLPVSLVIAGAAFVHASSEVDPLGLGAATLTDTSLSANAMATLVDRGFQAEMSARAAEGEQAEIRRLSDPLIALARRSFAVDPLEVSSLRTIALGSVLQEDEERARRMMRLANQLSKRDSVVDMWLAQDYGQTGDFTAMINTFDQALRTSVRAREIAIKPLVETLVSEDSYAPLGRLLDRRPEWETNFWEEFARNPVAMQNATKFFEGSSIPIDRMPIKDRRRLYANLKQTGQIDVLYQLAEADPASKASIDDLAAGSFGTADGSDPLSWVLQSHGTYAARIHANSGEMQIDARAGSFGVAAERIARVSGSHKLSIRLAETLPDHARVKLVARCAGDPEQELASIPLTAGATGGEVNFSADACPFANLELSFAVDPGRRDALLRVASIALRPA